MGAAIKFMVGIFALALGTYTVYSFYGYVVYQVDQVFNGLGVNLSQSVPPAYKNVLSQLDNWMVTVPIATLVIFLIGIAVEVYRKTKEGQTYEYD